MTSLATPAEIVYSIRVGEPVDMEAVADLLDSMAGLQEQADRWEVEMEKAQEQADDANEELASLRDDCGRLADELEDMVSQLRSMRDGT